MTLRDGASQASKASPVKRVAEAADGYIVGVVGPARASAVTPPAITDVTATPTAARVAGRPRRNQRRFDSCCITCGYPF